MTRQLVTIGKRLHALASDSTTMMSNLDTAIALVDSCREAYRRALDSLQGHITQASLSRINVDKDRELRGDLAQPFETITSLANDLDRGRDAEIPGPLISTVYCMGSSDLHRVPLEGLEPPTLSLGRNCSSIELQRLTRRVYRTRASPRPAAP